MTLNGSRTFNICFFLFLVFVIIFIQPYFYAGLCGANSFTKWGQSIGIFGILIFGLLFSIFLVSKIVNRFFNRFVWRLIFTGAGGIAFSVLLIGLTFKVNNLALDMAVWRAINAGQVIISALNEYKLKNNIYPKSLIELGIAVPNTNVCAYPNFTYVLSKSDSDDMNDMVAKAQKNESLSINAAANNTGGYELTVEMPMGILNWDVLVYWPSENYPDHLKGGSAQHYGKWIYVNE